MERGGERFVLAMLVEELTELVEGAGDVAAGQAGSTLGVGFQLPVLGSDGGGVQGLAGQSGQAAGDLLVDPRGGAQDVVAFGDEGVGGRGERVGPGLGQLFTGWAVKRAVIGDEEALRLCVADPPEQLVLLHPDRLAEIPQGPVEVEEFVGGVEHGAPGVVGVPLRGLSGRTVPHRGSVVRWTTSPRKPVAVVLQRLRPLLDVIGDGVEQAGLRIAQGAEVHGHAPGPGSFSTIRPKLCAFVLSVLWLVVTTRSRLSPIR